MDRQKIEDIRTRVSCATVLTQAGFRIDRRESSRGALKFRRDSEIIIVTHGGAGWFDPLSDRKGDVFALVTALEQVPFPASVQRVGELSGVAPIPLPRPSSDRRPLPSLSQRWSSRPVLVRGSPAYTYLHCVRSLPPTVLQVATLADAVRQGPHGSAWFRHDDGSGKITGWEERGAEWRGFSTGGAKTLFRFGKGGASYRICITEAAIDALSLAAIEDVRADTLYASTGGGWSPSTAQAIGSIAPGAMLVAATDADPQGEAYADRLRQIADLAGGDFVRLRPRALTNRIGAPIIEVRFPHPVRQSCNGPGRKEAG